MVGRATSPRVTRGRLGTRTLALRPWGVVTDMAGAHGRTPEGRAAGRGAIAARRIAEPGEVSDLVLRLRARACYLNAAAVTADGGWTT